MKWEWQMLLKQGWKLSLSGSVHVVVPNWTKIRDSFKGEGGNWVIIAMFYGIIIIIVYVCICIK